MEADPRIGTASGKPYFTRPTTGKLVSEMCGDENSVGMVKFYRRECFKQIGGFVRELMWDGIDCHRCRMLGWVAGELGRPGDPLRAPARWARATSGYGGVEFGLASVVALHGHLQMTVLPIAIASRIAVMPLSVSDSSSGMTTNSEFAYSSRRSRSVIAPTVTLGGPGPRILWR